MSHDLFEAARGAMAFAHAPYSKFPVGAAIRAEDGKVYTGANIENLSFPQGWCAEPTAISAMIMGGARKIVEMAVIAEKLPLCPPCGGCRQKIAEFAAMLPAPEPIRVLTVDDHPLMLAGVVARLSVEPDIDVVATAATCAATVVAVGEHQPDVLIADVSIPDGSLINALGDVVAASPATKIVLLSATDDPGAVVTALEQGAGGFLSKETEADELATHVRAAMEGKTVLDARSAAAVAARLREPAPRQALSARELEVLRLVADGRSNPEIGEALFVAASTVKTHLERAYAKLGVGDRAAAVARAKDLRLL